MLCVSVVLLFYGSSVSLILIEPFLWSELLFFISQHDCMQISLVLFMPSVYLFFVGLSECGGHVW